MMNLKVVTAAAAAASARTLTKGGIKYQPNTCPLIPLLQRMCVALQVYCSASLALPAAVQQTTMLGTDRWL
jgi:hypothetical protein